MAMKDYSTDPDENQTVGSFSMPEGQAANTMNNGVRQLAADIKDGTIVAVDNHAALTALDETKQADDAVVECLGKTTVGDGLGGLFYFDSASSATADGELILAPDVGLGRWIKIRGAYKSNLLDVSDATGTTEGETTGIYNKKSWAYRVQNLAENATQQWFKFTLGTNDNISAMVRVEAASRMPGEILGGSSVGWYHIGQRNDVAGPSGETALVTSTSGLALATPVVSGDDIIFGGFVKDNATATTTTRVDLIITLFYSSQESDFTFTGLDGTTVHTGNANISSVSVNQDLRPLTDDTYDIGSASRRFTDIYATNATIQTSTVRVKEDITPVTAELMTALSTVESKAFKMKKDKDKEVAGEGKARNHVGPVLEDIHAALTSAGLDPDDYDFLIGDGGFRPTEVLFLQLEALKKRVEALEP